MNQIFHDGSHKTKHYLNISAKENFRYYFLTYRRRTRIRPVHVFLARRASFVGAVCLILNILLSRLKTTETVVYSQREKLGALTNDLYNDPQISFKLTLLLNK